MEMIIAISIATAAQLSQIWVQIKRVAVTVSHRVREATLAEVFLNQTFKTRALRKNID